MFHIQVDDLDADTAYAIMGPNETERPKLAAKLFAEGFYEPVASALLTTDLGGMETLFAWTQNVNAVNWCNLWQPQMTFVRSASKIIDGVSYGPRSTMVGDVIVEAWESGEELSRWVVQMHGFAPMPLEVVHGPE
jgi:hypothetical protein